VTEQRGPCGHEQDSSYGHLVCGRAAGHSGPHITFWPHATIAFGWPAGAKAALLPVPPEPRQP
jgi:hypothetical protein